MHPFLIPEWPAPANVVATTTLRQGGVSLAPYDTFNLAFHVGDQPIAVSRNREILAESLLMPCHSFSWLNQVHGLQVVEAREKVVLEDKAPEADAVWTGRANRACVVMTADCLPVLFCDNRGEWVAAAHAGWRGLLAGVLEATAATHSGTGKIHAWLGPAIGPAAFEVGSDVYASFLKSDAGLSDCFKPVPGKTDKWYMNIYKVAEKRLNQCGVESVYGGDFCTVTEVERFYSYRRNPVTGRMASLIYLKST